MQPAFSYAIRIALLAVTIYGCARLVLAESLYARGMASLSVQRSLDLLTDSAEAYPWDFHFRKAQALQLYALAQRMPAMVPLAVQSLTLAVQADPNAPDLVSKLYVAQRVAGRCEDAAQTGKRLIRLVPNSEIARRIVALPCP